MCVVSWDCVGRRTPLAHRRFGGQRVLLFGRMIDTSWTLRPRGARPWHCGWWWFPPPGV